MLRTIAWVAFICALAASIPRLEALAALNRTTLRCRAPLMASGGVESALVPGHVSAVRLVDCSLALDELAYRLGRGPSGDAIQRWRIEVQLARADFGAALVLAQAARAQHPADSWYALVLGLVQHARGEYRDAARVWLSADSTGRAMTSVADRLLARGEAEIAAQYLQGVVNEYPGSAEARLRLAESLFQRGHSAEALKQYEIGFATAPSSNSLNLGEVAYHRAQLLTDEKRYDEAIASIREAIAWHPAYPTYTAFLGRVYSLQGDYSNAERWFDETLRIAPGAGASFWEYGQYYVRRQMYSRALPWFRKAVDAQPEEAPSFFYGDLGGAYLALGAYDRAIPALEEAVRRDSRNPTYRLWLDDAKAKQPG